MIFVLILIILILLITIGLLRFRQRELINEIQVLKQCRSELEKDNWEEISIFLTDNREVGK